MAVKQELSRNLGLLSLVATGVCAMMGASIYIVPFMIQRHVPGIGPHVIWSFLFAAIPAALAAHAYARLSAVMPHAGGSYIYVSRGLHPYLGFVASFAQWFGLSIAIGVISYVILPFFRDIASALEWSELSNWLAQPQVRLIFSLGILWLFVWVNLRGLKNYKRILIPMMVLMFLLGLVVIISGFSLGRDPAADLSGMVAPEQTIFSWKVFLVGAGTLFSSFIGFDAIAQAGGEARNPRRLLPKAITLAFVIVAGYYFLFTASVYYAVPWQEVARKALNSDVTAPSLLAERLPYGLVVLVILGAAIALINDLPAMLLSVSRLFFAWAKDGIFPRSFARVNQHHVPALAVIVSAGMASLGIIGCHLAGDFFLGVDIMVTSMLVNFVLMCLTLSLLKYRNSRIYQAMNITSYEHKQNQLLSFFGIFLLLLLLIMHTYRDLSQTFSHWYFHSTYLWLIVMAIASTIFLLGWRALARDGVDLKAYFSNLPDDDYSSD